MTFGKNSPLVIRLSAILHAGAVGGVLLWPELWQWFGAAVISNHSLLFVAVFFPRSEILGQNLAQLPPMAIARREVALTFDDGPDPEVTPQILDILAQYNAKASFFCVASRATAHPELLQEMIRQGHSVENHTQHHSNYFAFLGTRACKTEVLAAQKIIIDITGISPLYFRAPMGFRSPILDQVLRDVGLCYTSWTRRGFDTTSRSPARVLERLLYNIRAGDILLLHDGICWPKGKSPHITLQVLPLLLEQLQATDCHVVSLPMALARDRSDEAVKATPLPAEIEFGI